METPNYYAIIPAEVRYSNIKANAKLLYWEITALTNKTGECYASNRYFADLYNVSEKQVSLWIRELMDNWFIISRVEDWYKRFIGVHQKVMGVLPKGNRGGTPKGVYNNTSNNNTNNNISYSDDFMFFWKNFPHARSWNKKESFATYRDSTIDKMIILNESKLLLLEIEYWVIDWKYIKACQWWLKNLVHSEIMFWNRLSKICEKMIEQWTPVDKKRELQALFRDYDIGAMFAEIRDRKKNLLIKSIKDER